MWQVIFTKICSKVIYSTEVENKINEYLKHERK